jgi:transcriptional regulator with PAS, ATPase and Fis domain
MDQSTMQSGTPTYPHNSKPLKHAVHAYERSIIVDSLKLNNGDKRKVAHLLGISISSLYRKIGEAMPQHEVEEVEG